MNDDLVRTFPFLATIPARERGELLATSVRKTLANRQGLVRAGMECAHVPFVITGMLRIFKASENGRELTLYRIEPGETCILTATCVLSGSGFPANAEAEGPTDVLLMPSRRLLPLMEASPAWRTFLFGLYAKRLDMALTLVEEVAFHHVDERIAAYLAREATAGQGVITRTHEQIADELGTSREVVTRILRDFELVGAIETNRGRIRVLKPERLGAREAP